MYCRLICKSSQKYAFEVWKSYIHICIWMNAYIYTCQPHNSAHVFISCFSRMSNEKSFEYEPSSEWIFVRDSRIIIGGTFIKLHVFLLAWFELDSISKLHKRYYYTMFVRQTLLIIDMLFPLLLISLDIIDKSIQYIWVDTWKVYVQEEESVYPEG